jgi:lipoprotein NlpI
VRAQEDGRTELSTLAAKLQTKDWPYPLIELFLGKQSPEAAMAAAGKPEERCEAQFYIGEWQLLQGRRAAAARTLEAAAGTCPKDFLEYEGAQADLKRLGNAKRRVRESQRRR